MAEEIPFNYPPTAEDPCSCGSRMCVDCKDSATKPREWNEHLFRLSLAYYRLKHRILGRV